MTEECTDLAVIENALALAGSAPPASPPSETDQAKSDDKNEPRNEAVKEFLRHISTKTDRKLLFKLQVAAEVMIGGQSAVSVAEKYKCHRQTIANYIKDPYVQIAMNSYFRDDFTLAAAIVRSSVLPAVEGLKTAANHTDVRLRLAAYDRIEKATGFLKNGAAEAGATTIHALALKEYKRRRGLGPSIRIKAPKAAIDKIIKEMEAQAVESDEWVPDDLPEGSYIDLDEIADGKSQSAAIHELPLEPDEPEEASTQ